MILDIADPKFDAKKLWEKYINDNYDFIFLKEPIGYIDQANVRHWLESKNKGRPVWQKIDALLIIWNEAGFISQKEDPLPLSYKGTGMYFVTKERMR